MTEQQIEARAERLMDNLDRLYMAGRMSQAQYDAYVAAIDRGVATALGKARAEGRS